MPRHISALILSSSNMQLLCGQRNILPRITVFQGSVGLIIRTVHLLNLLLLHLRSRREGRRQERGIYAPSPAVLSVFQYLILFAELNNLNTRCDSHFREKCYLYLIVIRGSNAKCCECLQLQQQGSFLHLLSRMEQICSHRPVRFIIKHGSEKTKKPQKTNLLLASLCTNCIHCAIII